MADTPTRREAMQQAFALHLRNPSAHPTPAGLEDRRVQVYRELFFNNVVSLLAGNFPVLRSMYDEAGWRARVRDWYSRHRARTPLFPELGREFVRWLARECAGGGPAIPAWQAELAHYEWMEVVARNAETDLADGPPAADGDLVGGVPVLSPLVWPLVYRWPVHRLRADARPGSTAPAQATCLVIVRDRRDQVGFLEANAMTLRLLALIEAQPGCSGEAHLCRLAAESGLDPAALLQHGRGLFDTLRARDILLGVRPD